MNPRGALIAAVVLLAGCAAAQSSDPAAEFPAGTTLAWLGTDAGGARRNAPADPTRYTIAFEASGRATIRLDCNRGSAQWTRDGAKLSLGARKCHQIPLLAERPDERDVHVVVEV